ncbi:MAG: O-antigen ligase family protein [Solirubrobacterales bacterium]
MTEIKRESGSRGVRHGLVFCVFASLVVYYALSGGAYDTANRHEAAIAIWFALGLSVAFGTLPAGQPRRAQTLPPLLLAIFAISTASALLWTGSAERTGAELGRVLFYLGLVLLVGSVVHNGNWRPAAGGLTTGVLTVTILAVASRLLPDAFPTDEASLQFETARLSYPLNYWNAVAAWGAVSVTLAVAQSAHARTLPVRALLLATTPISAAAIYLTYSRGGLAAALLGVCAVIAFGRNRWLTAIHATAAAAAAALVVVSIRAAPEVANATGDAGATWIAVALLGAAALCAAVVVVTSTLKCERLRLSPRAARACTIGSVTVALLVAGTVGRGPITGAWDQFRVRAEITSSDPGARLATLSGDRYAIWSSAVDAFTSHPVRGIGPGTFEFWWNEHGGEAYLKDAHSLYLEVAAELGVIGVALLLAIVAAFALCGFHARRGLSEADDLGVHASLMGVFIVFIAYAGVDWMWEVTAFTGLCLAAVVIACAGAQQRAEHPLGIGWRLGVAGVAALVCVTLAPALVSNSAIGDSRGAVASGDLVRALELADEAVRAEPWAASPYVQRAAVMERGGATEAAIVDLARAIGREPGNWRHYLMLSRMQLKSGDSQAALRSFRRGRAVRPQSPYFAAPIGE